MSTDQIQNDPPSKPARRDVALILAKELLSDIELSRVEPMSVVRKAGRLARLLDDVDAMGWLGYESTGYPSGDGLGSGPWAAAERSGRVSESDGSRKANCSLLGELMAEVEAAKVDLAAGAGDTSDSQFAVVVEKNKALRRNQLLQLIKARQGVLDKVIGAVHQYVGERYQELRFGSAVETAFTVVRREVDGKIAALVPDALPMLSAAFENASSDNLEQWQNAAGTCRRLLMAAADRLRPSGPDVDGRRMGQSNYVNRLVNWIVQQTTSDTAATMVVADLEHLGLRLDAADRAGQKGAHVGSKPVTRVEASRFVTGTYLVLGDILGLVAVEPRAGGFEAQAVVDSGGAVFADS